MRLAPLRKGMLPDLSKGEVLVPTFGTFSGGKRPPQLRWLSGGDLLVIRGDVAGMRYGRYHPSTSAGSTATSHVPRAGIIQWYFPSKAAPYTSRARCQ